jgi:hypothetical protein
MLKANSTKNGNCLMLGPVSFGGRPKLRLLCFLGEIGKKFVLWLAPAQPEFFP